MMNATSNWKRECVKIARDFDYEYWLPGIIDCIKASDTEIEAENWLTAGRHAMLDDCDGMR